MRKWDKLDNAAKIFPSTVESTETRVFRVYCELYEDVQPDILQQATDLAVKQLPQFQKILRRGLFWYYTEKTFKTPVVREETKTPCSKMYYPGQHNLMFEVTYYKKRINLEIFHVLADGTGGTKFLYFILANYLQLLYPGTLQLDSPLLINQLDVEEMEKDSFDTYYTGEKNPRKKEFTLVHLIRPKRRPNHDLNVTEAICSTQKLLDLAHSYHCSLTEFMVSLLIKTILENMKPSSRSKAIVIDIPINLRAYFPSVSTKNFFAVLPITYMITDRNEPLECICAKVSKEFETTITRENLEGKINSLGSFERIMPMRLIPLFLKEPGLRFVNFLNKRFVTGFFSNMGKVVLPEEMVPYIDHIGVASSTISIQAECASFEDKMTMCFTDGFLDATIKYEYFHKIEELGVPVTINTNTPAEKVSESPVRWIADPRKRTEEKEDDVFPLPKGPETKVSKTLFYINVAAIILMLAFAITYILTKNQHFWSLIMIINTFFIWNGVARGLVTHTSIMKKLFYRYVWTSVFYLIVDIFSGWQQWSVLVHVPMFALINIGLCLYIAYTATAAEVGGGEVMLYASLEAFIGVVPMILCFTPVLTLKPFAVIAGIICALFLAAILIFRWRSFKYEYKKTFHF